MVLFKAPNVIPGFVDPADTAQAFTEDGWLISGDIGRLDEQGRLHLQGRAKDLIIRGGHNIDPKTIEDALASHPAVRLCAAVGAPDAYAGELPVASSRWPRRPGSPRPNCWPMPPRSTKARRGPPRHRAGTDAHDQCGQDLQPDLRRLAVAVSVQALVAQALRERPARDSLPARAADAQPQVAVQALPDARRLGHGCARRWRGCPAVPPA